MTDTKQSGEMPRELATEDYMPMVLGALKSCIDSHGPITKKFIASASKRIVHGLREVRKKELSHVYSEGKKKERERIDAGIMNLKCDLLTNKDGSWISVKKLYKLIFEKDEALSPNKE